MNKKMIWQPIETAPKGSGDSGPDDTRHHDYVESPRLLLWTEDGECVIGAYDWYYHKGYGMGGDERETGWCDTEGQEIEPTHWMPLPEGPK